VPELLAALDAFLQEHSRCGELDSDVEEGRGWMSAAGAQHEVGRVHLADDTAKQGPSAF
jgi:hypothetical protein